MSEVCEEVAFAGGFHAGGRIGKEKEKKPPGSFCGVVRLFLIYLLR